MTAPTPPLPLPLNRKRKDTYAEAAAYWRSQAVFLSVDVARLERENRALLLDVQQIRQALMAGVREGRQ